MDTRGRPVRGSRVWIKVSKLCKADEIRRMAVQQMTKLNCKFDPRRSYTLCYADGRIVDKLPGNDIPFTLDSYREITMKDYSKVVFFMKDAEMG